MRDSPWLRFDSAHDAAKALGFDLGSISKAVSKGRTKWHGKMTWMWRYAPNPSCDLLPGEELREITPEIAEKTRMISMQTWDDYVAKNASADAEAPSAPSPRVGKKRQRSD